MAHAKNMARRFLESIILRLFRRDKSIGALFIWWLAIAARSAATYLYYNVFSKYYWHVANLCLDLENQAI